MKFNSAPDWVFYVLTLWSLLWSGIVLWRTAKLNQKNWFILFLFVHTAGILELIYLFYFAKKKLTIDEARGWLQNIFPADTKSK